MISRQELNAKRGGFTLIEVLIAVVIISIVMVPLGTAYVLHHRAAARASGETTAVMLAQDRLEEMKSRTYAGIAGVARRSFSELPGYGEYAAYEYEITVTTGALGVKTITVTVYYPIIGGTGTVTLETERRKL